jgi:hypothetical protein
MLGFEREVVAALLTVEEADVRGRVEQWVEGSLRTMPELIRLGLAVQSVVFGAVFGLLRIPAGRAVTLLEKSPLMPMRQYVRALRSLVLFGEQELA